MNPDLSLLIGLHHPEILEWTTFSAELEGFSVYTAVSLEEMKELLQQRAYCGYLMDLNLGHYGGEDISPAREIYTIVRERVERQEAVFLGISGNDKAVRAALREHIPAESKPFQIFPFFQHCREMGTK